MYLVWRWRWWRPQALVGSVQMDRTGQCSGSRRDGNGVVCTAWLEFHLTLVYPNKTMNKENFWHRVWWVPGRAPWGSTSSIGSRMKIQELGFNPFKLSSAAVSAPISVQQLCPFTGAVDQVWAGVDLWAAPLAESSSWLCVLQGIIISEALSSCQIPKHSLVRGHSASGALISVFCSRQQLGPAFGAVLAAPGLLGQLCHIKAPALEQQMKKPTRIRSSKVC